MEDNLIVIGILGPIKKENQSLIRLYDVNIEFSNFIDENSKDEELKDYFLNIVKHYYDMFITNPILAPHILTFKIGTVQDIGEIGIYDRINRFLNLYQIPDEKIKSIEKIKIASDSSGIICDYTKEDVSERFTSFRIEKDGETKKDEKNLIDLNKYIKSNWKSGKLFKNLLDKTKYQLDKDIDKSKTDDSDDYLNKYRKLRD